MKGKQGKRKKPNLKMKEAEAIRHKEEILADIKELADKMNELAGIKKPYPKYGFMTQASYCCETHKKTWERINRRRT